MRLTLAMLCGAACLSAATVSADTFTYTDQNGAHQTLAARLLGSGQGVHALLKSDGQIEVIPQAALDRRDPADGPDPLTPAEMQEVLEQRFGKDLLRTQAGKRYVVAFLAAGPLDRRSETRVKGFLQKASRFMNTVDTVFTRFARSMQFPIHDPEFPLVVVIFESDADFNTFADENTGGQGLSARRIAGFYSGLTNWLAIRLEECRTFRVPLHEAIHQQMYNRVFQRLAPVPKWFDEGIATGFENDGDKVDIQPAKINRRYAWLARNRPEDDVSWADIVDDDASFEGDILAAESYIEAWSLHWMLVTQHKDAYRDYVQELAAREPLEELPAEQRGERFQAIFGQSVSEIAEDFPRALEAGMRRQNVAPPEGTPAGVMVAHEALAELQIHAANDAGSGRMLVEGQIRNTSPIRALTYHVAIVADSGTYTDWVIDGLDPNASAPLDSKVAAKVLPGTVGGVGSQFTVRVQWALPGSDTAKAWARSPPVPAGIRQSAE